MNNKQNIIYKNAPLVEAVFEIRFPGEPAIECNRDKFYKKIKNKYPKVYVPKVSEGKAIALEPYHFNNDNDTCAIMVSINRIAFSCKKYEGFSLFKRETLRVMSIFGELFKIKKLNRTGLRYINIIPFTREKDIIPLFNFLNIKLNLSKSIPINFKNISIIIETQTSTGSITTRIESVKSKEQSKEAIMLDFDYAKETNLQFQSIDNYLNESHQHTKHLFEELITENYKKVMWGEVI